MRKILIAFLLIFLLSFSACSKAQEQPDSAIDFTLEGLDGKDVALSDVLKEEKTAVLLFWAAWCPYCRTELPRMEKFYQENKDKVEVIAVDVQESRAKVERFVRKMELSYPIVLDTEGDVARNYNVLGVPTIVAVDKDGKIIYYGYQTEEMQEKVTFKKGGGR